MDVLITVLSHQGETYVLLYTERTRVDAMFQIVKWCLDDELSLTNEDADYVIEKMGK